MAPNTEQHIEKIRGRAYEIYLERCRLGAGGHEREDWSRAERELGGAGAGENRGRAKARRGTTAETVTDEHGHDIENPT
jgi:hypothetical protein